MLKRKQLPVLFVSIEKHDNGYYLIDSEEELNRVLYSIIKERYDYGYYPSYEAIDKEIHTYSKNLSESIFGEYGEISEEEIAELPEALKKSFEEKRLKFDKAISSFYREKQDDLVFAKTVEKVMSLSEKEAVEHSIELYKRDNSIYFKKAVQYIIEYRADHQYEEFQLIDFDNIENF